MNCNLNLAKRTLSLLLALTLLLGNLPATVFAEGEDTPVTEPVAAMEETTTPTAAPTEPPAVENATEAPTEAPQPEGTSAPTEAATEPPATEMSATEPKPKAVFATSVTVSQKDSLAEVTAGETLQLEVTVLPEDTTDKTVIWSSSDEKIATVDEKGEVTALEAGSVTITATCGEVEGAYELTVKVVSEATEPKATEPAATEEPTEPAVEETVASGDGLQTSTGEISAEAAMAAASGTCGENLTWTFDEATGKLTISGTGAMTDYTLDCVAGYTSFSTAPWCNYISSITSVELTSGVTTIGNYAFYYCLKLTNITIPDSVTSIGHYAFAHCYELTSITIPDSVTSLGDYVCYGCTRMTSATIGNGVTTIGNSAFYSCSSLENVTIGNGVTSIGEDAFDCPSLTDVYITDIYAWRDVTFENAYSNPMGSGDNLHILDAQGNEVTEFVWDSSRTAIPGGMFSNCSNLTNITIPDSVTSIGERVFYNCSSLTSITLPDSVTSIPANAFYGCAALASITIPDSVTSIGNCAFEGCSSLTSITIPDGVPSIGYAAFEGCSSLTSITIPDSVTSIGNYAFEACSSLTSIMIPSSVTYIAEYTFYRSTVWDIYYCGSESNLRDYSDRRVHYNCSGDQEWIETHWEVLEVDVTCTEDGYTYEQCSCGHTRNKTITTPRSHKLVIDPAVESTCMEPGKTEGSHCDACQKIYVPQEEIAPSGHYVLEAGKVSISSIAMQNDAANPFEYGQFNGSNCYASTNHENRSSSVFTITALYDCWLSLGYAVYSETTFDELTISVNDTIEDTISGEESKRISLDLEVGDKVYIRYYKDSSGASGEDRGYFWISSCTDTQIDGQKRVPVTDLKTICTDEIVCAGCNQIVKPATEHSYNSVVRTPTCTIGGYTTHTCSACGDKYQDADVPALGHNEVIIPELAPTCYEFGLTESSHCSRCGKTVIEQSIIPYSHSYSDGRCTVCNQYSSMEGLCGESVYWRLEDNGTSLYIYGNGTMYDYTGDAPWMVYKNKLTKVVVEDGVENIGNFAFYECSALNSVVLGDSVQEIGEGAFQECLKLTRISLPKNLKTIEMLAFFSTGLYSLVVPDSVSYIGSLAFSGCNNLYRTTIGRNPSLYIGASAFAISSTQYMKPEVKFLGIYPPSGESCVFTATDMTVYYPSNGRWSEADFERLGMYWTEWIPSGNSEILGCNSHRVTIGATGVPSTCTRQGYSEMTYCSDCGLEIEPRKLLPLLPHSENIVYVEEPTCKETGLYNIACTVCNVVLQKNLVAAPYGHDFSASEHKCVRCDYHGGTCGENLTWIFDPSDGSLTISGTGAMDDYSAGNAPWYAQCQAIRFIRIAAGVTAIAPDAFHGTPGEVDIYYGGTAEEWSAMGINVSANDRVHYFCTEPEGHWQFVTVEMTCEEDGYTAYRCDCGHEYGRTVTQPAAGHVTVTDAAVAPICLQPGLTEGQHCTVCEKVLVAQEVIPATGHAYEKQNDQLVCNTCGQEVYVRIRQDYLAMDLISFREVYLDLQVSHEELKESVVWTVEGDSVIDFYEEELRVAVENLGNAWITATVTVNNGLDKEHENYEEFEVSSHCRVEVAESIQLKGIQLSTATVTTELYKNDYTGFEILLQLPDYYPEETASTYSLRRTGMMDEVYFKDEALQKLFKLEILDDRSVLLIPDYDNAVMDPGAVLSKYTNVVVCAKVQNVEYESEPITLVVKKTKPKLTGTVAAFNSFFSGQSNEITIKGATPVENGFSENEAKNTTKATAIPTWLELGENGTLTLAPNAPLKSTSGKAYIEVMTEQWRIPAEVTVSVKNTFKAPGLKLSASSVTMSLLTDDSKGAAMKLLCTGKKDTLAGLSVEKIEASGGFKVEDFNVRDGSFVLRAPDGFKAPSKGTPVVLTIHFGNTNVTRDLKVTVKTKTVSLKLASTSITLNREARDSIKVKVTATPADYQIEDIEDLNLALTATQTVNGKKVTVNKLESGELEFGYENGNLIIRTTPLTPEKTTYKLSVSSGDSKAVTATITVKTAEASVTYKASGSMDLSFPAQTAAIKPTFKNYKGDIQGYTYTVQELKGSTVMNADVSESFAVAFDGTAFRIRCTNDEIDTTRTYKVKLVLTLNDGSTVNNTISLKVKRTAVKLKLGTTKLTLNKLIGDEISTTVACATKGYAFTKPIVHEVKDKNKLDARDQLAIRCEDSRVYVAANNLTEYGMTYTITLRANEKAASHNLTVTIPTEAKSKVTVSLKASGKIDVIRDGSAVTVTPTYKNRSTAQPTEEQLYIYSSEDKYKDPVNERFSIVPNGKGGYTITNAMSEEHPLKHGVTYKVKLVSKFGSMEVPSSLTSMSVTMGSTKLTTRTSNTTLFAKDKNDRALVWFEAADGTLNDVSDLKIKDTKYKDVLEVIEYGDGLFAIGFKNGVVDESLQPTGKATSKTVTVTLNVFMEGNRTTKANTTAKVKLTIVK